MLAIPWFVLETTGSAAQAGITGFFMALPAVISSFLGGPIIDRLGYKPVSVISDLVSGATVAFIPLLYHLGALGFWHLQALVFLGALLDTPGNTARSTVFPNLAGAAGITLERANSLLLITVRAGMLIGPLVGGALVATMGAANVLWVDAATFAVSAFLVGRWVPRIRSGDADQESGVEAKAEAGAKRSVLKAYVADLAEGIRFLRTSRLLLNMMAVITFIGFLEGPIFTVLLPTYANRVLGNPTFLGGVIAAFAAGSMVGTLVYGAVGDRLPRRRVYLISWVIVALAFFGLSRLPSGPMMIGLAILLGIASGPINPIVQTVVQERVPLEMRGRAFGLLGSISFAAYPLGPIVGGYAVEAFGIRATFTAIALLYVLATIIQVANRALREMDVRQEVSSPTSDAAM